MQEHPGSCGATGGAGNPPAQKIRHNLESRGIGNKIEKESGENRNSHLFVNVCLIADHHGCKRNRSEYRRVKEEASTSGAIIFHDPITNIFVREPESLFVHYYVKYTRREKGNDKLLLSNRPVAATSTVLE